MNNECILHPADPCCKRELLLITGSLRDFIFVLDLSWIDLTMDWNEVALWLSVFINCLIRASSFSCHLQSWFYGLTEPFSYCACVSVDQCKRSIWEREEARGSITLTLCAVCNLIWEAVISDRAAALTRYALPEWQIRLLQLDWRVYRCKSEASLIMSGQCVFCVCLIRLMCSKVCWLAL